MPVDQIAAQLGIRLVYMPFSDNHARMVVGSANLTNGGLEDNVELVLGPKECQIADATLSSWVSNGLLAQVVSSS